MIFRFFIEFHPVENPHHNLQKCVYSVHFSIRKFIFSQFLSIMRIIGIFWIIIVQYIIEYDKWQDIKKIPARYTKEDLESWILRSYIISITKSRWSKSWIFQFSKISFTDYIFHKSSEIHFGRIRWIWKMIRMKFWMLWQHYIVIINH